jgi:alpha,alpha-trehalase
MVRNEEERDGGAATRRPIRPAVAAGTSLRSPTWRGPATDSRVLATIDAIAERLTDERGPGCRYDTRSGADGLEGREGTFVLCTFWLAQALALAGQPARARHVFERAITYLNDVGLLAEEVDPATGELPGNFPQAFSHIGLINAAWAISEAERRHAASRGGLPAQLRLSASAVGFRARPCCPSSLAWQGSCVLRGTGSPPP